MPDWPLQEALPLSRRGDPASSMKAAERGMRSGKFASDRSVILSAIKAFPGVTARRLAEITGIEAYTVRKRTADLRNARPQLAYSRRPPAGGELVWFPGEEP